MPTIAESLAQMDVSRQRWSRVGELWTQGPVSERSTVPVSADAYATLLGLALSAGTEDDVRRLRQLRRLYYGPHARWPEGRRRGVRLDALLSGGEDPALLAWSSRPGELDAATVDALHAAAYLLPPLPSAVPVDTGAVLAGVETVMAGGSDLALAAEYAVGVPADGTAGWAGDLAAWLLEWIRLRAAAEAAGTPWNDAEAAARLDAVQAERVPLELMLGMMDGRVLGVHLGSDVNPAGTPPEVSAPLGAYYGAAAPESEPHVSTRFASFVAAALPAIPHTGEGTAVALGTDAAEEIRAHVAAAAAFLAFQGWRDAAFGAAVGAPPVPAPPSLERAAAQVEAHGAALDAIVSAFVGLLQAGLGGETTFDWPRAT